MGVRVDEGIRVFPDSEWRLRSRITVNSCFRFNHEPADSLLRFRYSGGRPILDSMVATLIASRSIGLAGMFFVGLCLYLLPSIAGAGRKVVDLGTVLVVNILLGWTGIGWVVALAFAMRTPVPQVELVGTSNALRIPNASSNQAFEVRQPPPPDLYRQAPDGPVRWWDGSEWGPWYAADSPSGATTPRLPDL